MIKIEHWELSRMRKSMPEVVEELQRKVEERDRASRRVAAAGIDCRPTYGRWSREVRCETGAVPPL